MTVVVYNTHFPHDPEAQTQAAYRLWTHVIQEEAVLVVVGGDFNATLEEMSIRFLTGEESDKGRFFELTDSWGQVGIGPAETNPSMAPVARIDYIF